MKECTINFKKMNFNSVVFKDNMESCRFMVCQDNDRQSVEFSSTGLKFFNGQEE